MNEGIHRHESGRSGLIYLSKVVNLIHVEQLTTAVGTCPGTRG